MFSLEHRRQRGGRRAFFKDLKGSPTEEGQDLFFIILECRTDHYGHKLEEARFQLNIRKPFLTVRAVQQWNT